MSLKSTRRGTNPLKMVIIITTTITIRKRPIIIANILIRRQINTNLAVQIKINHMKNHQNSRKRKKLKMAKLEQKSLKI
jgi:hypothetical protein